MTIDSELIPRGRRVRLGYWLGGIYFFLTAAVFILTALTTRPDKVGLDWIPFYFLTMPWSRLTMRLAVAGALINTALLCFIGTSLQILVRRFRRQN